MPPRKDRIPVVFDTNIIVAFFLSKTRNSVNSRVFDLWLIARRLQLLVTAPVIEEYLELLDRIGVNTERIERFNNRLRTLSTVTHINLGKRYKISRDSDDDVFLATAQAGHARFLVTNDRDLLDIPPYDRQTFSFEIVKPYQMLSAIGK
ncbi:MAG TPA: putative toxin-antitoxin system toxin component, PIN family [Blastocatellia bacterium]|nr:putative toxin-antitoxin system toxin component, PIN family [Blastocatellia bacterium]